MRRDDPQVNCQDCRFYDATDGFVGTCMSNSSESWVMKNVSPRLRVVPAAFKHDCKVFERRDAIVETDWPE